MTTTQTPAQIVAEHLDGIHVYGLAARADLADPDTETSPGADWLRSVRAAVTEQLDYMDEVTPDALHGERGGDWLHEAADALVPVYTAHRWRVFTDLAAWQVDVSEYSTEGSDLTELAGVALYEAARALMDTLLSDAAEQLAGVLDEDYPGTCAGCGEGVDSDGIDSNGSRYCDDEETTLHHESDED